MDGGNHAVPYPDPFVNHVDDWSEAICGAGGGGDEMVLVGIIQMIVHAHDDVQSALLDRRRDDHFFHAGLEVKLELLFGAKFAARLQHDIDSQIAPRDVGKI